MNINEENGFDLYKLLLAASTRSYLPCAAEGKESSSGRSKKKLGIGLMPYKSNRESYKRNITSFTTKRWPSCFFFF